MTQALSSPAVRNLRQCLDGFTEVVSRLADAFGVQVVHTPMPVSELALFDPATRTIRIRDTASVEDQVWALADAWHLLTIGPWATSGARRQPSLQLVPHPRAAED